MQKIHQSSIAMIICLTVFVLNGIGQNAVWKRMTLAGTGLSVESPVPLRLDQDKPDPSLEYQKAYVRWSLRADGAFGTFVYEETTKDARTPRQEVEYYAKFFSEGSTPKISRITDITFLGQSATKLEQQMLDPYEKKEMYRIFVVFGSTGKLTNVNLVYPVGDANAKRASDRVFASVQLAGTVAPTNSLEPPSNWKTQQFAGLSYQTPNAQVDTTCPKINRSITGYVTMKNVCHKWGDAFSISIDHDRFALPTMVPAPTKYANDMVAGYREADTESKLKAGREYTVKPFQVTGAEAAKLEQFTSVGTVGTRTDQIFIRKGADFWTVNVIYPLRYDFQRAAAERIINSIAIIASSTPTATSPSTTVTTPIVSSTANFEAGKVLAAKGQHAQAITKFTDALSADPKNGQIYIFRAISKSATGDRDGAISDYSAAIDNGDTTYLGYYNRGTVYYLKADYLSAIRDFTTSIRKNAKHVNSLYNRGLSYFNLKQADKALDDFTNAIRLDPKNVNAYLMRARVLCGEKLILSAIKDEDKAISLGGKPEKRCGRETQ